MNFQVMEEMYHKYKEQVNFLWAYSREAHPEEAPFPTGFETRNLGWEHRYFEPTTMDERAQRARWMRQELEPDAQIPMIIDYMNSPLGPDNAIWNAYTGGGFYAGFVIDTSATVIYQENWAWRSPGGKWWGLPLAPAQNLEAFLDAYLADTPGPKPPGKFTIPSLFPLEHQGDATAETLPTEQISEPTVLIVADDVGSGYESYFQAPLGNLKLHAVVWDVQQSGGPSLAVLENYRVVVWLTGDATQSTLTAADQANLAAYLDGGGKLLLSGQNIGQNIGASAFYGDYLHATLIDPDVGGTAVVGADVLSGIDVALSGNDGAGNQQSPSQIGLLDGAAGVFRYDTPDPPAWAGLRWAGDHQVVYLAFGMEGFGSPGAASHRFATMKKLFHWFDELPCWGDQDFDEDVDLDDLERLVHNLAGPDRPMPIKGVDFMEFAKSDLDLDEDIDLGDFAEFQRKFGDACN